MRVSKLAPSAKVQGRWLCHMEDETILRVTEGEVVSFGLYTGMELDDATLEALTASVKKSGLRTKALNLIARRPLSRRELVEKLTAKDKDGAEPDMQTAIEVADWLEELGYINDAEYAKTVVRHYSAKGYGQGKIRDELWRRGVPRELWDEAKAEAENPDEGIDAFLRQKLKGQEPDPKTIKRVSDALARRGYRWSEIKDGLRRYGAEIEE